MKTTVEFMAFSNFFICTNQFYISKYLKYPKLLRFYQYSFSRKTKLRNNILYLLRFEFFWPILLFCPILEPAVSHQSQFCEVFEPKNWIGQNFFKISVDRLANFEIFVVQIHKNILSDMLKSWVVDNLIHCIVFVGACWIVECNFSTKKSKISSYIWQSIYLLI